MKAVYFAAPASRWLRRSLRLAGVLGAVAAALVAWGPRQSTRRSSSYERWVDANHLRVEVRGRWQDVPMVPLADHLCHSGQPLFLRYCN